MGEKSLIDTTNDLPISYVDRAADNVAREVEAAAHAAGRKAEELAECRKAGRCSSDFVRLVASGRYR